MVYLLLSLMQRDGDAFSIQFQHHLLLIHVFYLWLQNCLYSNQHLCLSNFYIKLIILNSYELYELFQWFLHDCSSLNLHLLNQNLFNWNLLNRNLLNRNFLNRNLLDQNLHLWVSLLVSLLHIASSIFNHYFFLYFCLIFAPFLH